MATRLVLGDLLRDFEQSTGVSVGMTSVGGVDAARRIAAGEHFDVVVLASDAIDKLMSAGRLAAGSRVDLVRSGVAVAVKASTPLPDLSSETAVRQAVLAAPTIGYSTGPSGTALIQLFQRWGIMETLEGRLVQARAGVPVASLVASGEVALGFQQLSELLNVEGIQVAGPLPDAIQITTTFSAALPIEISAASAKAVHALLAYLTSPEADAVKRRHGMSPA